MRAATDRAFPFQKSVLRLNRKERRSLFPSFSGFARQATGIVVHVVHLRIVCWIESIRWFAFPHPFRAMLTIPRFFPVVKAKKRICGDCKKDLILLFVFHQGSLYMHLSAARFSKMKQTKRPEAAGWKFVRTLRVSIHEKRIFTCRSKPGARSCPRKRRKPAPRRRACHSR